MFQYSAAKMMHNISATDEGHTALLFDFSILWVNEPWICISWQPCHVNNLHRLCLPSLPSAPLLKRLWAAPKCDSSGGSFLLKCKQTSIFNPVFPFLSEAVRVKKKKTTLGAFYQSSSNSGSLEGYGNEANWCEWNIGFLTPTPLQKKQTKKHTSK